ncbi:hypothetical protein [Desulfosporosinus sp. OT]|uniref:hypothetical protein n=1 Tax=Desulfosporosinus sp. OT TaxID=913865 RepID=UPI0002239D5F|nr:hypothetical protein [Desulfosporosinus sp. OT]EGW37340.1 hypothetical protein DOT_4842 [Desulfosporosinus sp. OT]
MKRKHLYLLLLVVFLSSTVAFKVGYNNSESIMINVFESSKNIINYQIPTQGDKKFAYLTDSYIKNLGGDRFQVDSYVDCQNDNLQDKRIRYTMIVHWDGQEYAMEKLNTEGL